MDSKTNIVVCLACSDREWDGKKLTCSIDDHPVRECREKCPHPDGDRFVQVSIRKPGPPYDGRVRGLGDVVHRVAKATGIDRVAKAISRATGKPCNCPKRRQQLNELVPL